ncbi:MAG: hypothetical protein L6R42_008887 [Xanthoria sp. 1 TBL-2021]|nr:MAG: hypothetical protein L6R42_008887 [Xanthoria sp. 1 TBL-2021]
MDENEPFKLPQAVLDAMKGINAPTTEDKNPRVRARLLNSFRNYLGQETESNGGEFTNAYNVAGSAIIAIDNTSPAYCANMDWETFRPSTNPKTGDALKALLPPMNS